MHLPTQLRLPADCTRRVAQVSISTIRWAYTSSAQKDVLLAEEASVHDMALLSVLGPQEPANVWD